MLFSAFPIWSLEISPKLTSSAKIVQQVLDILYIFFFFFNLTKYRKLKMRFISQSFLHACFFLEMVATTVLYVIGSERKYYTQGG